MTGLFHKLGFTAFGGPADPIGMRHAKVHRVTNLIERAFGWPAPQLPHEFKAIEGQRRSAKLPDLVKKHGSFDKFLANEEVFSYVILNKNRVNYTTGIVIRNT